MKRLLLVLGTVCVIVVTAFRFFPISKHIPIQKWDEQTNISIITNPQTLQHFPLLYKANQPFFEKPPLWYWVSSIAMKHISNANIAARTISAICGLFVVIFTTFLAWRWWGSIAGLFTWITLMTTNHLFVINPAGSFSTHTLWSADLESIHIFFLMISFAYLTQTFNGAAIIVGVSAGLSMLSKSPLGLLPLIIATFIRPNGRGSRSYLLSWTVAIATILPWYLWMIAQFHLPFLASHFNYHMAARIQLPLEGHEKSIWYYAQILAERRFFMSWEWLVGSVFFIFLQKLHKDQIVKFTLLMAGATFIIPTIMSTKLAWYLLPFYPFAGLVIGFATSTVIHMLHRSILTHRHTAKTKYRRK